MHRLFHTLVVCGTGLTLVHCGGKSTSDRDDDADDGSGGSTYSGGVTGVGGAVSTTGGSAPVGGNASSGGTSAGATSTGGKGGAAGSVSTGGVNSGGVAGTVSSGGAGAPPVPTGPSERWTCSNDGCFGALSAPAGCVVDPDRPIDAAECGADEVFTCMAARLSDGTDIRVNCECRSIPPDDPHCPCPTTMHKLCNVVPSQDLEECADGEYLCGCAITCILK